MTAIVPEPSAAALQEGQVWIEPFMPYGTSGTGHCRGWAVWRTAPADWRLDYNAPGAGSFSESFSTSGPASSGFLNDLCDGDQCPPGSSATATLYRLQADGNDILVDSFTLPC
jgi:hypothetical protein